MIQNKMIAVLGLVAILVISAMSVFYTVDEREKAIVIRLGKVIRYDDKPGLHWKWPVAEEVRFFDSRIITLDAPPQRYLTKEKKTLVVDSFVKWRVADTLKYYLTVQGDEATANTRLQQLVNGGLRTEFGKRTLHELVAGDRDDVMKILQASADKSAHDFGIEVVDVRLKRVDLPEKVSESVYLRMEAERTRIAKEHRAKGAEAAEKIRAEAERKREVLLAEAYRESERTRGDGDAKATAIYARALKRNPEFYTFYRSLNAYKKSFSSKQDVLILDPSSEFFKYMKTPRPR
ncbi:MAG: protease modulator HflC [Acidiferrobacterales bacterium]